MWKFCLLGRIKMYIAALIIGVIGIIVTVYGKIKRSTSTRNVGTIICFAAAVLLIVNAILLCL